MFKILKIVQRFGKCSNFFEQFLKSVQGLRSVQNFEKCSKV